MFWLRVIVASVVGAIVGWAIGLFLHALEQAIRRFRFKRRLITEIITTDIDELTI